MAITLDKLTNDAIKADLTTSDAHVKTYLGHLRTANKSLYVAMQDAYRLSQTHSKVDLQKAAKEIGIKFQTTATAELTAIKLVFRNADTSKASAYAAVLIKARDLGTKTEEFAKWIEDKGGIEKIRIADLVKLSETNKADKATAIAAAAEAMKGERSDGIVFDKPSAAHATLPVHKDSKKAIWFVNEKSDGSFELIAVQTSKPAIDAMSKRVGEALANPTNVKDFSVVLKAPEPKTDEQDEAKDRLAAA